MRPIARALSAIRATAVTLTGARRPRTTAETPWEPMTDNPQPGDEVRCAEGAWAVRRTTGVWHELEDDQLIEVTSRNGVTCPYMHLDASGVWIGTDLDGHPHRWPSSEIETGTLTDGTHLHRDGTFDHGTPRFSSVPRPEKKD